MIRRVQQCSIETRWAFVIVVTTAFALPAVPAELAAESEVHWAFRPVIRPPVPAVNQLEWPRNPIDNFVLARLEREQIEPSPEADPETTLRRVSLDLTGLPPSVDEVDQFLSAPSSESYGQVVERRLASPHYGERWGRHWLDIARYADSAGYEFDKKRDIWKFRDWIINAFNSDMPYDQFLIEQLAGDLIQPADEQRLVATGFSCNARKQGSDPVEANIDRVNAFGTAYLGLTLGCAQCHDHKFDPISQTEYFQFYAFFNQADDVVHDFASPQEAAERDALNDQVFLLKRELASYQGGPDQDPLVWAARLSSDKLMAVPSELRMAIGMLSKDRSPEQLKMIQDAHSRAINRYRDQIKQRVEQWAASMSPDQRNALDPASQGYLEMPIAERTEDVPTPLLNEYWKHDAGAMKRLATIEQLEGLVPHTITTLVMHQQADHPKTYDQLDPSTGIEVSPGVPACLPPLDSKSQKPTRLDLARWAASPANPLTARVAVNRIWQRFFGTGIVETSDNFGTQASPPSHPELLDWLAAEFIEHRWSRKHIQRLIVNSATYLQSSQIRPELDERDPENRLLARQSRLRLDAETIRDTSLAVGGILNLEIGGPSVFPYQPGGVMAGRADGTRWTMSEGAQRLRRGLYIHFWRLTPHPYFRLFDAPDAVESCPRRPTSNSPLQALTLLNDPWFVEAAGALARRVMTERVGEPDEQRLEWLFETCTAREIEPAEKQVLTNLLMAQRQVLMQDPTRAATIIGREGEPEQVVAEAAWMSVSRAVLNLDEFITRE
jgi:Protein of unknown function (DUF1553)/Protein of unknown function (DUF1549)